MKTIRIFLDAVMYLLFVLLMGQHLTETAIHEWLGVGLLLCFIFHNIMNYKWYRTLLKGKSTASRTVQTIVNFLLLISFLGCMSSALMISCEVFTKIRLPGIVFGRKLHMFSTAWCFVFMSIHLGLHIKIPKKTIQRVCIYIVLLCAAFSGVYHFIIRRFYEELFLLTEFKWFDYDKNIIVYFMETICISALFAMVGYLIKLLLRRKRK